MFLFLFNVHFNVTDLDSGDLSSSIRYAKIIIKCTDVLQPDAMLKKKYFNRSFAITCKRCKQVMYKQFSPDFKMYKYLHE